MKKDIRINPVGLKGREINERMIELMGIKPINENKSNVVIELTKIGPDGNAYAIVRENHEWYIKKTTKTSKIVAEDFKYIGGLMNKKDEAYSSYAKAIKHLNLKFKSLAEAYNFTGEINVFENDNLLSEDVAGFAEMKGMGFTGEGNLEGNKPLYEEDGEESAKQEVEEELSEGEAALKYVDEMLERYYSTNEELKGGQSKLDKNENGKSMEEAEEMSGKDKELAAKRKPFNKITQADVLDARGVDLDEELYGDQDKLDVADFKAISSMEESIKRLDALFEGELKKKV